MLTNSPYISFTNKTQLMTNCDFTTLYAFSCIFPRSVTLPTIGPLFDTLVWPFPYHSAPIYDTHPSPALSTQILQLAAAIQRHTHHVTIGPTTDQRNYIITSDHVHSDYLYMVSPQLFRSIPRSPRSLSFPFPSCFLVTVFSFFLFRISHRTMYHMLSLLISAWSYCSLRRIHHSGPYYIQIAFFSVTSLFSIKSDM